MPSPEFEAWWAEVQREPGALRDSHYTATGIGNRLAPMEPAEQSAFLAQLIPVLLQRHRAYGIAFFLLDGLSDPAVLDLIAENLRPLAGLQTHDEEAHLADLIRILAAACDDRLLPAVEAYLIDREIGDLWATVPWALWPHQTDLFARAWARFLRECTPSNWSDPLVARSFLSEPDAIDAVRVQLGAHDDALWQGFRDALLSQASQVSWFTTNQLAALERGLK